MTDEKAETAGRTGDKAETAGRTGDKAETAGKTGQGTAPESSLDAPALAIITAFGGIRPMASKLEVAVSTVQGWKERGAIPANRHEQILAAAKTHGVTLDAKLLEASDQSEAAAPAKDSTSAASPIPASTTRPPEAPRPRPSPGPSPTANQPAAHHSWVPPFLLGALVMAVGVVAAIFTVERWYGPTGDDAALTALQSQVTTLSGELTKLSAAGDTSKLVKRVDTLSSAESALGKRIEALEHQAAQPSALPGELADLSKSNQDLSGRLSSLQGKLADLDKLEKQVATLSDSLDSKRTLAAGEVAKLLAIDRLRFALAGSEPYKPALDQLKASLGHDPAAAEKMGPLEDHATEGLPTVAQLRLRFPAVAKSVVAAGVAGDDGGFMSGVWKRLANVVSVRPIGPAEGGSPGAMAARAEVALEAGDLASAVEQLEGLSGGAAEAAAGWLAQAKARVAAEQALAAVSDQLVAQLTAAGG